MCVAFLFIFLLSLKYSASIISNRTDDILDLFLHFDEPNDHDYAKNPCSLRLHSSLEKLRKRQNPVTTSGFIDLSGYALHQTLRHAPFDMYVTDIRVRTPGTGNWVHVERCQFTENRLIANLLFNDLAVTGNVRLFEENTVPKNPVQPAELCSMTVRLKRAGLGLNAFPTRGRSKGIDVRTEARFVDPNYLSVHAYGCKLNQIVRNENRKTVESPYINHRYLETQIQQNNRFKHLINDLKKHNTHLKNTTEMRGNKGDEDVRIITLMPNLPGKEESPFQLDGEEETDISNYHKERILSAKFQNERDKLKAVLHVKNLIAQQANQVFQVHGPFSQGQVGKPLFEDVPESQKVHNVQPVSVISSITELDENLKPVLGPQESIFTGVNDKVVNNGQTQAEVLTREMEDMFLRGIKTLLTKYLEKQLEIPLKEALMVSIGYTVSYG